MNKEPSSWLKKGRTALGLTAAALALAACGNSGSTASAEKPATVPSPAATASARTPSTAPTATGPSCKIATFLYGHLTPHVGEHVRMQFDQTNGTRAYAVDWGDGAKTTYKGVSPDGTYASDAGTTQAVDHEYSLKRTGYIMKVVMRSSMVGDVPCTYGGDRAMIVNTTPNLPANYNPVAVCPEKHPYC